MQNLQAVLSDPNWFPHRFEAKSSTFEFVRIDRARHQKATFLDDEHIGGPLDRIAVPSDAVLTATSRAETRVHFIFHSAFACSTLMTRALDYPREAVGLKEPAILNDLANLARRGSLARPILDAALALLGRPFGPGEAIVIKASNVANFLIDDILALRPKARVLLLYAPLKDFLLSVAGKGMFGRIWARRTFTLLQGDGLFDAGFSETEKFEQTDLQIAALAWLAHQAQFAMIGRRYADRVRAIDSKSLLANKVAVIGAASHLFGLSVDCERVAHGPVFTDHSKEIGRAFDADERVRQHNATHLSHGEEIDMIVDWSEAVTRHVGVSIRPGRPSLG